MQLVSRYCQNVLQNIFNFITLFATSVSKFLLGKTGKKKMDLKLLAENLNHVAIYN